MEKGEVQVNPLGPESQVSTQLVLSDSEKRVLELYDRLQQLQLEIALLTAQKDHSQGKFALIRYALSSFLNTNT
jgi:chaperonin cofactor prefoldin